MFRWDDLRLLLAVHRHGSLAAAGRALGVDASTASRRMRAFEQGVGALLFDRTPDGLRATSLAERLLPHAEEAEAAAIAAEAAAAGADARPEGRVRLACADAFAVYVLAPRVVDFAERWPGIRLEIMASPRMVDLARREADVALRFLRPTQGDLVAKRVHRMGGYGGFVHQSYLDRGGSLEPQKLRWIGWNDAHAHLPEARLYQRLVGRPAELVADNLVVMMEAARAGAGALLLPLEIQELVPDLIQLESIEAPDFEVDAWVVCHRALRHVPRITAVMEWVVELLQSPG